MRCSRCRPTRKITAQAERRLKVLQSLDTLGAGFQLASHDLDIRGAGNLLGEEQSGHIKEVGFELYQQMLEEAVMSLKAGIAAPVADRWSPQITIGTPVLIPEDYVADLPVRLALYRRLADLEDEQEIEAFGAELVDRFGPLPEEVEHLLQIVAIKALCRRANVEKIEAGPKGAVLPSATTVSPIRRTDRFIAKQGAAAGAARHEGGVLRRLGEARATLARHHGGAAQSRAHRRAGEGGLVGFAKAKSPGLRPGLRILNKNQTPAAWTTWSLVLSCLSLNSSAMKPATYRCNTSIVDRLAPGRLFSCNTSAALLPIDGE